MDTPPESDLPDFNDPEATLAWADGWVRDGYPSVAENLAAYERQHLAQFESEFGRGLQQFYSEYGALLDLIDDLNFLDRTHWPEHRRVQFVLLAKNLGALHSTMDRLAKGFYQDAITLIRGSYDAWLRAIHISLYPDNPYAALVHRPPKGVPAFNATDLVKTQLRLHWLGKYRIMSAFAHANTFETARSLMAATQQDDSPERFGLAMEYDEAMIGVAFPFLEFVVLGYLRFALEVLLPPHDAPTDSVEKRAVEAVAFLRAKFCDNPKEYWHEAMDDLDYVHDVVRCADDGGDWRVLRDARPPIEDLPVAQDQEPESRS